jgi:hypothetical protein
MPRDFRPMAELNHTNPVDMMLEDGSIVTGWLFQGMPHVLRSYWTRDFGPHRLIEPIGWREPPSTGERDCSARRLAA